MPFINQLGCFVISLMVMSFGVRVYIFKILDRLANGEDMSIKQARYPLYFMLQVMLSLMLACFWTLGISLEAIQSLITHHELKISALSLIQFSVILIFGVLNIFLIMRPLINKITKLREKN